MSEKKPIEKTSAPDLKDIEPGSDAEATPVPEVGKTTADPKKKKPD
ncbi:hypothetical protein [Devosia psychrophila]|nr:hypothetical protein [Devosia psychrophila]